MVLMKNKNKRYGKHIFFLLEGLRFFEVLSGKNKLKKIGVVWCWIPSYIHTHL